MLNPVKYKIAVNGKPSYKIAATVKPHIKLPLLLNFTSGYPKGSFKNAVDVNGKATSKTTVSVFFFFFFFFF